MRETETPPGEKPNSRRSLSKWWSLPLGCLGLVLLEFTLCGGLWYLFGRDELLAEFNAPGNRTVQIYAEPEFHYEPPGYISFELRQNDRVIIPQRRFMGIGPERKPAGEFRLITSEDESIIAITLDNEIRMMHDLSTGETWPGPYTNISDEEYELGERLLKELDAESRHLTCPAQKQRLQRKQRGLPF